MKKFFVLGLLLVSASSFANSSEKLVEACRQAGEEKIAAQALDWKVYFGDIKECGVDNRPSNPFAKYVWFCAKASDGREIKVMTQKPLFKKCF